MSFESPINRLIVVSNRLPFVLRQGADGQWQAKPGSGGLISALVPTLGNRGGVWVGWPGVIDGNAHEMESALTELTKGTGYILRPVILSGEEQHGFYYGFSNEIIWPLFHDLVSRCNFDPGYWAIYQQVNRKFAKTTAELAVTGDFIWVQDYQLIDMAREMRQLGHRQKIGFFLHIPFPPLDIFLKLPWRFEILEGLLQYDLIGFQALRDRRNFIQCVRTLLRHVRIEGKGQVLTMHARDRDIDHFGDKKTGPEREIRIGTFPIGIDFKSLSQRAQTSEVEKLADQYRKDLYGRKMVLGMDRLDYTKGIPSKIKAFANALRRYPEMMEKVTLIQNVVLSRSDIPEYQELKLEIERLVGEINGEFTTSGWVPIHYICDDLSPDEIVAYYRTADIALVTPLKDGMNLVSKEYCAAHNANDGVLILSEFAGAAAQLKNGALLVNPYDIEGVADRIYEAFNMSEAEQAKRMRRLRGKISNRDIFWWTDSFLRTVIAKDLSHFPVIDDYIPRVDLA